MALTDRQYYHIFREPSFTTATSRSAQDILVQAGQATDPSGEKLLIAAPGAGKQIILLSISTSMDMSLGTGTAGASTFFYIAEGGISFPSGYAVAENSQVSTNRETAYVTITYIIADV